MMNVKLILMIFSLILVTGCATSGINRWQLNIIDLRQEEQLGQDFSKEVKKEHRILKDVEGNAYLDRLGHRLLQYAAEVNFDYTFKLVDSNEINAFALPGGHIYVNRGLFTAADNEAEVAGVIAHEIGHVVSRHGTERLTALYGYNLALSLALGNNPDRWVALAANLFGQAGILAYSRAQESEADALGVNNLYRAGYDPKAMVTFFEKLLKQKQSSAMPEILEKYMSSHPLTEDRIAHINRIISKLGTDRQLKLSSPEFNLIKARLSRSAG